MRYDNLKNLLWAILIAQVFSSGCQESLSHQLHLVFPNPEAETSLVKLFLWASDPVMQTCEKFITGELRPGELLVHTSEEVDYPPVSGVKLARVPSGDVAFLAEGLDENGMTILRGCKQENIRPGASIEVTVELVWVASAVIIHNCATSVFEDEPYICTPAVEDPIPDTAYRWNLDETHTCSWASIDAVTGEIGGTPANDDVGVCSLAFKVNNGLVDSEVESLSLTVVGVNDPPALSTNTGLVVEQATITTISRSNLEVTDPDDQPTDLIYTVETAPLHGTLERSGTPASTFTQNDINSDLITYRHDGSEPGGDGFTFSVTDGTDATASLAFDISIVPSTDPCFGIIIEDDFTGETFDTQLEDHTPICGTGYDSTGSFDTSAFTIYASGYLSAEASGPHVTVVEVDPLDADYSVSVWGRYDSGEIDDEFGPVVRAQDQYNYYVLHLEDGYLQLYKVSSGIEDLLDYYNCTSWCDSGTVYKLTLEVSGTSPNITLTGYLDDVQYVQETGEMAFGDKGKAGVYINGTRPDVLQVTSRD